MERMVQKGCCGKYNIILKIDYAVSKALVDKFVSLGYREMTAYTKSNILYVSKNNIVVNGAFGGTTLKVHCANVKTCEQDLLQVENIVR
jgi:hypothetical protein